MTITAKLGNMRKAVQWTVYPANRKALGADMDGSITIQSDTRIATFDPVTGKGLLSAAKSSGAYFLHLNKFMGATDITVPADVIAAALAVQPKSGDMVHGVVRIV
jgi:hypothetical protein